MSNNQKEISVFVQDVFDNVIQRIESDGFAMPDKSVALEVTSSEFAVIDGHWEEFKDYVEISTGRWTPAFIDSNWDDRNFAVFKPSIRAKIRKFLNMIFGRANNSGLQPAMARVRKSSLNRKSSLK